MHGLSHRMCQSFLYDVTQGSTNDCNAPSSTLNIIGNKQSENVECAHFYFASSESFINYLLQTLHPKIKYMDYDPDMTAEIMFLLNVTLFCSTCMSVILSTVSFTDIIHLYGIHWFTKSIMLENSLQVEYFTNFWIHLFYHPKMYKIMIKTCVLTKQIYLKSPPNILYKQPHIVHDFDFICFLVLYVMTNILNAFKFESIDEIMDGASIYVTKRLSFVTIFGVSVKYWNKYQIKFFLKRYQPEIQKVLIDLVKHKLHNSAVGVHQAKIFIAFLRTLIGLMSEIQVRSEKLKLTQLLDRNIVDIIKSVKITGKKVVFMKQSMRKELKNTMIRCSWVECNKYQFDMNKKFGLCSACKMTYYCSKSCQKKAWNKEHRNSCHKISHLYANF